LEERVAALEAEVDCLRRLVEGKKPGWKQMVGAFQNDPYYEEAVKYGREYRESTRPKPRKQRKRKNEP
jgi:hypothetical protein